MHLSKVFIPWLKARNPYEIHRELWGFFPGRPVDNRDFLYRTETTQRGVGANILLQSRQEPFDDNTKNRVLASRAYNLKLVTGQKLRFRLRANPIKTITDGKKRYNQKGVIKKCRVPLIREVEQKNWLSRKFEPGCSIESLIINRELPTYFRKARENRIGKIQTVMFDGIICIQQSDCFLEKIRDGIGPGKAFGCGLLSIAAI